MNAVGEVTLHASSAPANLSLFQLLYISKLITYHDRERRDPNCNKRLPNKKQSIHTQFLQREHHPPLCASKRTQLSKTQTQTETDVSALSRHITQSRHGNICGRWISRGRNFIRANFEAPTFIPMLLHALQISLLFLAVFSQQLQILSHPHFRRLLSL